MSEGGYKIRNQEAIHFITFAVTEWVDVFTRKDYRDIVIDSLRFCQAEKALLLQCKRLYSSQEMRFTGFGFPIDIDSPDTNFF